MAGSRQDLLKSTLVKDKRLFVCPNLGNSAFPVCPSSDLVAEAAAEALSERKMWMLSSRAAEGSGVGVCPGWSWR